MVIIWKIDNKNKNIKNSENLYKNYHVLSTIIYIYGFNCTSYLQNHENYVGVIYLFWLLKSLV